MSSRRPAQPVRSSLSSPAGAATANQTRPLPPPESRPISQTKPGSGGILRLVPTPAPPNPSPARRPCDLRSSALRLVSRLAPPLLPPSDSLSSTPAAVQRASIRFTKALGASRGFDAPLDILGCFAAPSLRGETQVPASLAARVPSRLLPPQHRGASPPPEPPMRQPLLHGTTASPPDASPCM